MNIPKIVSEINQSHLVIAPTDTVYGILADALDENVIENIYQAKQRSHKKPLLLLVNSLDMLQKYVDNISPLTQKIISEYWPGKLTFLFKKNPLLPDNLTSNNFIGIRFPNHPELLQIIQEIGHPIIATSANLSNHNTITRPSLLEPELLTKISYIEDSGEINNSPSALIKVEGDKIKVLRNGEIIEKIKQDYPKLF